MRVSSGPARKKRIKKILKQTKGMRAGRRRLLRSAKEALMRSGQNAYTGRKIKKRDFRSMWIVRIPPTLPAARKAHALELLLRMGTILYRLGIPNVGLLRIGTRLIKKLLLAPFLRR